MKGEGNIEYEGTNVGKSVSGGGIYACRAQGSSAVECGTACIAVFGSNALVYADEEIGSNVEVIRSDQIRSDQIRSDHLNK